MYWTDNNKGAIMSADKFTGNNIISIESNIYDLVDLKVMEIYSQRGK